jgi:hypothetical protein
MIPLIPTVGVMVNSIWGYYVTESKGAYSAPTNIPTWQNTNFNGAWSPSKQALNGHSYSFPLCAPCPIKIYSGSVNSGSTSTFSLIPQIQFITTSIAGNDLFLPTPTTINTANYEKFYSPVLAQDGCFYAFDYIHISASTVNPFPREVTNIGKIMKLDPSTDRYTTYSFIYPTTFTNTRMVSSILGRDGWIYGIPNASNTNFSHQNNCIFRFHPTNPTIIESSSILGSVNSQFVGQYIGTLSSRPGAIYWVPRVPSTTKTLAIVLTSSQFSAGTLNGISTIPLPADLIAQSNDLAYWPSKGHESTGYTYWAPRINTPNSTLQARTLVLDPYGGSAGTGSFTLDTNTNVYSNNGPGGNFTFGFARSINGDLFSLPASNHSSSIIINKDGVGSTSNFYPINNSLSPLQYPAIYPALMRNGINIWPSNIFQTKTNFSTTPWRYFMSVKGYYKNVTNFTEYSSYNPPPLIAAITSSTYNWLENNVSGN